MWEFWAGGEWRLSHSEQGKRAGAHIEGPSVSPYRIFSSSPLIYHISRLSRSYAHCSRRALRGCVGVDGERGDGLFRHSNALCSGCCLLQRLSRCLCGQSELLSTSAVSLLLPAWPASNNTRESICGVHAQKQNMVLAGGGSVRKRGSEGLTSLWLTETGFSHTANRIRRLTHKHALLAPAWYWVSAEQQTDAVSSFRGPMAGWWGRLISAEPAWHLWTQGTGIESQD